MLEALITLIVATSILLGSPGPAPLALAATSAVYGINKTLPFYLGILAGLAVAIVGAVFGVSVIINSYPSSKLIMQLLGGSYLIYIAYKIATGPTIISEKTDSKLIPTFFDGFILNLLNPKAYAAFFAIFTHFLLPNDTINMSYLLTACVVFTIAVIVDYLWMLLGAGLGQVFSNQKSAKIIRFSFASIIILLVVISFII
ncbi:MAG: LysE family translocator [Kangiellaceae bacterium]|nr:LysE family translocator [Kangiellaceae bacterium]